MVAGLSDKLGTENSDEWRIPIRLLTSRPATEAYTPPSFVAIRQTFMEMRAEKLDAEATLRAMLGEEPELAKEWSSEDYRILLNEVIASKDDLDGQLRVCDALVEKLGRQRHQVEAILPKIENHLARSGHRDESSGQVGNAPEALKSSCDERIAELEVSGNTDAPIFKIWPNAEAANDDLNEYVQREVRIRKNQSVFRQRMLRAYGCKCAITGEGPPEVLEAAHIEAHAKCGNNSDANGLLLRADIHRLFDRGLITLDLVRGLVHVDSSLRGTPYDRLECRTIARPTEI
ncbi:MAG: HNH endonuclease [Planctomycetes bacterium]|nr:HNH endonuclease [Planctomycetota bacterium]